MAETTALEMERLAKALALADFIWNFNESTMGEPAPPPDKMEELFNMFWVTSAQERRRCRFIAESILRDFIVRSPHLREGLK